MATYNYIIANSDPGGYDGHYTTLSALVSGESGNFGSGNTINIYVAPGCTSNSAAVSLNSYAASFNFLPTSGNAYNGTNGATCSTLEFSGSYTGYMFNTNSSTVIDGIAIDGNNGYATGGVFLRGQLRNFFIKGFTRYGTGVPLYIDNGAIAEVGVLNNALGGIFSEYTNSTAIARNILVISNDNTSNGIVKQYISTCTYKNIIAINTSSGSCFIIPNATNVSNLASNKATTETPPGANPYTTDVSTSTDFEDFAGGDYHLASGSGLATAGVNLYPNPQYDIDGDEFPSTGDWPIGFDYIDATGSVTLVLSNCVHGHQVDSPSLVQANNIIVNDSEHTAVVEVVNLVTGVELVVFDTEHGHTVDALALAQAHNLVIADTEHGVLVDNIDLTQSIILAVAETTHAQLADALLLLQKNILSIDNVTVSQVVDNIGLIQKSLLTVADAEHNHTVDGVTLSSAGNLNPADVTSQQLVDVINLLQANQLVVADTEHGQIVENIDLSVKALLSVNDSQHSNITDNVDLTTGLALSIADVTSAQTVDDLTLTQANILLVNSTEHQQQVDNINLSEAVILSIADTEHGQVVDNVQLTQAQLLDIQDVLHTAQVDNISLVQKSTLIVSNALHQHLVDNIILPGTLFSAGRLVVVNSIGKRLIYIASHDRVIYVMKTTD